MMLCSEKQSPLFMNAYEKVTLQRDVVGTLIPAGTKVDYRAAMTVKAPLPGFIVRRATDALVSASLPGMFAAIDREVARRKQAQQPT